MKPKLQRVAALQRPRRGLLVEESGQQPVERRLSTEAIEIDLLGSRQLSEPLLKAPPKRSRAVVRNTAMLKHAGACLQELVRPFPNETAPTAATARKVETICLVRRKRDDGRQEVAFGARPFILCGLPIRRPADGSLRYSRRNGRFFLEVVGHPNYGLPFGQDRLIPLWIATQAVRRQSRTIEFESASQLLHEWGLPQNGSHYRRLADGFRRIFGSTIFFGTSEAMAQTEVWDCGRLHFFERMRLWFRPEPCGTGTPASGNLVTLSETFWEEIRTHPVPVEGRGRPMLGE